VLRDAEKAKGRRALGRDIALADLTDAGTTAVTVPRTDQRSARITLSSFRGWQQGHCIERFEYQIPQQTRAGVAQ
jgi:hypothetical protein